MASENEVFQAKITAKDESSKTVDEIGAKVKHLGHEFLEAGKAGEHMHQMHSRAFFGMSEHLHLFKHELGGVTASLGETGSKVSELLPVFAAFGAAASLEGVVENIDHTAEAFSKLHHEAVNVGVSMAMLQGLHFAGAMSDTSPEVLDGALMKLNKTLGTIAAGGGKEALSLFKHLRIALKDAHGQLRSAGDILPDVADAFMHTTGKGSGARREKMATLFMGKSGGDMIDLLSGGGANLKAQQKDFERIGFVPNAEQREQLEAYHKSMVRLQTSTEAAMQAFGTAAAPGLQPILDGATAFLTSHRQAVGDTIEADLKPVQKWIEGGGLDKAIDGLASIAHDADAVAKALGGWGHATELLLGMTALKGGMFFIEPIAKAGEFILAVDKLSIALGTRLVGAWGKVTAAAGEAESVEALALAGGAAHGAPGKGAGGGGLIAGAEGAAAAMVRSLRLAMLAPLSLSSDSGPNSGPTQWNFYNNPSALRNYRFSGDELAALPLGEDTRLFTGHPGLFLSRPSEFNGGAPAGNADYNPFTLEHLGSVHAQGGKLEVTVDILNAPPGTTARARSTGPGLDAVQLNVGHAWTDRRLDDSFAINF